MRDSGLLRGSWGAATAATAATMWRAVVAVSLTAAVFVALSVPDQAAPIGWFYAWSPVLVVGLPLLVVMTASAGRWLVATWAHGGYEIRARLVSFGAVGLLVTLAAAGLVLGWWLSTRHELPPMPTGQLWPGR